MNLLVALLAVTAVGAFAYVSGGVAALRPVVGFGLPAAAILVFLAGLAAKVWTWSRSPVPFRITTTTGQQRSLSWIRSSRLDNPSTTLGVIGRMALEVLLFRSLFRNNRAELRPGPRLVFGEEKLLWLAAIVFHWSFLIILLRHLRFFFEPVPGFVTLLATVDGFFQVGLPIVYVTDLAILAGLAYLLGRRLADAQVRYLSLVSDYVALWLLLGLAGTGVLMRYFTRVDVVAAKQYALGLVTGQPTLPTTLDGWFFVHVAMVSALLIYFPFSKLMHMAGVLLSPTRNLANTNRMKRHINPWDYPVKVHTYQEWEEEFHDKIVAAGLPLDQEGRHV
jgi:nitrate reductase gamma subunit